MDSPRDPGSEMAGLRVTLLVAEKTREAVFAALRSGAMYVSRGSECRDFVLDDFSVDGIGAGGEGETSGFPVVHVNGRMPGKSTRRFTIRLVRDAEVVKVFEQEGSVFAVSFTDTEKPRGKGYYRAEINADGVECVTNPVFIRKQ